MKNEKFLSCNNKIESRIVYFRSFSPYVIIIIFHWDIKWCVNGTIYNSYTLINANETCKTFWWLRFRSDLSTFGILTMAKYYVFISFQSRGESPPTLSTTLTCFAGWIRFSYVKIHERERKRRGRVLKINSIAKRTPPSHLSHGHLETCLFFSS